MDIVERLHSHPEFAFEPPIGCLDLMDEAADEIARLREHCDRMASLAIDNAKDTERAMRLREALQQITELNPFKFNTGHVTLQYITQMLVEMTALAHEALKEKE